MNETAEQRDARIEREFAEFEQAARDVEAELHAQIEAELALLEVAS